MWMENIDSVESTYKGILDNHSHWRWGILQSFRWCLSTCTAFPIVPYTSTILGLKNWTANQTPLEPSCGYPLSNQAPSNSGSRFFLRPHNTSTHFHNLYSTKHERIHFLHHKLCLMRRSSHSIAKMSSKLPSYIAQDRTDHIRLQGRPSPTSSHSFSETFNSNPIVSAIHIHVTEPAYPHNNHKCFLHYTTHYTHPSHMMDPFQILQGPSSSQWHSLCRLLNCHAHPIQIYTTESMTSST